MRIHRFRWQRASRDEADWLGDVMQRECKQLGAGVEKTSGGNLELTWT